ncbi:Amylopullulanase [Pontiella desulfatans]|uniref:Amylopullulanase n=1 Tax=Pontiella desulfatans TaxID=2750659 RepID=A0A6C2TZZ0_PONDE|nr:hypothetical protein [Pontiella desulfatans]VGO13288.1 Amylopullulanase [Pontiella desulfatans]
MKIKGIALFAALLATTIGAQAQIATYTVGSSGDVSQLYSFGYDGTNVTVAGGIATNTGSFTDAQAGDVISWTLTGATGWSRANAQASHADFNSYATNFTYGQNVGYDAGDIGGVNDNKINSGEVMIIDFDVSGLQAGSVLTLVSTATANASGSSGDWVLVDTNANKVVQSKYGVSKGAGSFGDWQVLNSSYRLYYAGVAGGFRVTRLTVDVVDLPSTNVPPQLAITPNNSRLTLNWDDDPNPIMLDHYDLYRSLTSNEVDFALLASPVDSAYTDLAVTNGVTYYYKAKAVGTNSVETAFGNMVSGTPSIPVPAGLSATPLNTKVALDWNNSTDPLFASFMVWSSEESGTNYVVIASNLTASAYTHTNLINGTANYYVVQQVDSNSNLSALSAEVSATPAVPVPTGLAAVPDNQEVALDWDASIDDLFASFNVWRSLESGVNYSNIATVTTNAYTDNDVTNNVVYYYKVSQLDTGANESALSAAVAAEPAIGPVLIDFRSASGGAGGTQTITLSDLGNDPVSYANSSASFGGAGLSSAAKDSFTVSTATGKIVIKGRAYSDDGPLNDGSDDFQPLTWSGGDLTNTFEGTTGLFNSSDDGTGVQDVSGSLAINPGEAILIQFDLSGFTNAAGTSLVIKEVTGGAGTLYRRNFDVATGVSGAGEAVLTGGEEGAIVVEDGDTFAWMNADRLGTLTIDIVEILSGYNAFADQYGLNEGPEGDDDDDGVSNLGEYAINGNPTNAADRGQTSLSQDGTTFTYVYASNSVDSALVYRLIDTTSLTVGPFGTNNNTVTGTGPVVDDYAPVTNTYSIVDDTLFINLEVEK